MNATTMPLGFSFLYFTPRVQERHLRWLTAARTHGYDGVELPIQEATADELAAMRAAARAAGLRTTAVGFATAAANPISPDRSVRTAAVDLLRTLVDKAADLGAEVLAGPVHSAYATFTGQPPTADERARAAEVLRAAGEHAAACGVRIAVEPLNRFECYLLNTASDCDALVRSIGLPSVVAALDTHHAHLEEQDIPAAITAHAGTLGHVQLSENHRGTPGTGQVPFARVLRALADVGYRGWLVVEAFSRQDPGFGSALHVWRELDGGPDEVLAAGAALRRLLDAPR